MTGPAARDEGRPAGDPAGGVAEEVAPVVVVLGGGHEVGPLGEQVREGEGRALAIPGVEVFLVEGGPGLGVGGEGDLLKGLVEVAGGRIVGGRRH